MREIITTIMIIVSTTTGSNCVLGDGIPIGIEGVGDINTFIVVDVGSEKDVDKDTNNRTLEVDELNNIKLMEVVVDDDNMLVVLEVCLMWRLLVSDVKG